jgi:hypothetical protein
MTTRRKQKTLSSFLGKEEPFDRFWTERDTMLVYDRGCIPESLSILRIAAFDLVRALKCSVDFD